MNNAVFGKIMENMRNHVNMRLLTRWESKYGAEALIAKSNFHSRAIPALNNESGLELLGIPFKKKCAMLSTARWCGNDSLIIFSVK